MPYHEALVSSTTAIVPRELLHRSSCLLAFSEFAPPAEPVAAVFASGEPICIFEQPASTSVAAAAAKANRAALSEPIKDISHLAIRLVKS